MVTKTIDCNDPKHRDTLACALSIPMADLLAFTVMVTLLTIVVWAIGAVIIVLFAYHSPRHRVAIIIGGIILCILISPVAPLLIQKFVHWPIRQL
jgi:uncharacterized membrane protein